MKKIFYFLCAALFIVSCTQEPEAEQKGGIYGVIADNVSGEPLAAASIELGVGYSAINSYRVATLKKTISGSDGKYEFQGVETDLSEYSERYKATDVYHYVEITKQGYQPAFYRVLVQNGQIASCDALMEPCIVISTQGGSEITSVSVKLNAAYQLTYQNPYNHRPMSVGFYYDTTQTPKDGNKVNASEHWIAGNNIRGDFNAEISGLMPNTTYYVQAFASNDDGTFYGEITSFKTMQ